MARIKHFIVLPRKNRSVDHLLALDAPPTIADAYDALAANPELFVQPALVVTYDEHGGFYDHVPPGAAPVPNGQNSPNPDDRASFKPAAFSSDLIGQRVMLSWLGGGLQSFAVHLATHGAAAAIEQQLRNAGL